MGRVVDHRLDVLEKAVDGLVKDKERLDLWSYCQQLEFTIGNPDWWDRLDFEPEARLQAIRAVLTANKVLMEKIGLHVQMVTVESGR